MKLFKIWILLALVLGLAFKLHSAKLYFFSEMPCPCNSANKISAQNEKNVFFVSLVLELALVELCTVSLAAFDS